SSDYRWRIIYYLNKLRIRYGDVACTHVKHSPYPHDLVRSTTKGKLSILINSTQVAKLSIQNIAITYPGIARGFRTQVWWWCTGQSLIAHNIGWENDILQAGFNQGDHLLTGSEIIILVCDHICAAIL